MSVEGAAAGNQQKTPVDLVFEGGGIKGIGLVGAYKVLEEREYQPACLAGASAGAIVAALVAAQYSAADLKTIMEELDFNDFKDKGWEDYFPFVPVTISILKDRGIYEGTTFSEWVRGKLADKGVETFEDLIRPGYEEAELKYRYKLQVIVSDLTGKRLLVLPRDAGELGYDNPNDFNVAQAIRMSMSIPFFFEPVKFNHLKTGQEYLIVDGGMLSNFPVWVFDAKNPEEAQRDTFGVRLVEPDPQADIAEKLPQAGTTRRGRLMVVDYIRSLVETMLEAHDRLALRERNFNRTIDIDTLGIRTTEFDLSTERKEELYQSGRKAANEFLDKLESG
jgi:NTE family protein